MKYQIPPVPMPEPVTYRPSDTYNSKAEVERNLERHGLEIIGYRPPERGDKWLTQGSALLTGLDPTDINAIYTPKFGGPARFIVRYKPKVLPVAIPLDQAWE